jgi:hypothetical protein
MLLATVARCDTGHHLRAIGDALLGMKSALFAGKTLANNLGAFVDKYAHEWWPSAEFDGGIGCFSALR